MAGNKDNFICVVFLGHKLDVLFLVVAKGVQDALGILCNL